MGAYERFPGRSPQATLPLPFNGSDVAHLDTVLSRQPVGDD